MKRFLLAAILALVPFLPPPLLAQDADPDELLEVFDVKDLADSPPATAALVGTLWLEVGEIAEVDSPRAGLIVVRGPKEAVDRVSAMLARLRSGATPQVLAEARFLRVRTGPGEDGVEVLGAPSLVCEDGQEAKLDLNREDGDGFSMTVRPTLDPATGDVALTLTVRVTRVIDATETREIAVTKRATLPDGGILLLDLGTDPSGGRLFLHLSCRKCP